MVVNTPRVRDTNGKLAEYRVVGPPGTGKTTRVAHQVGVAVRAGKRVLIASLTRAAAAEAARLAQFRTWTSADGGFTVKARMAGYAAGTVTLEKEDKTTIKVPLDQLSESDQQFVRDELKRR